MAEFKPGDAVDISITGAQVYRVFHEGPPEDGIDVVQVVIPDSQYVTVVPLDDPGVSVAHCDPKGGAL